jgi:F-type H+-transporting ATPase subunit b
LRRWSLSLALLLALGVSGLPAQEHGGHEAKADAETRQAGHGGEDHGDPYILWKWANFAILAGVLGYLISKKAGGFFRERTAEIQRGIQEAAQLRRDAEARAAEIEVRIGNLQAEINSLRSSARSEMDAENSRLRAETEQALQKVQSHAEQEIASAAKNARQELAAHSAQLALELAEQRIRAGITPAVQDQLVQDFVGSLSRRAVQ